MTLNTKRRVIIIISILVIASLLAVAYLESVH